ncbi:hypothetical protein D6C95_05117 [Aureobasidium pullulans]|nr:hypothetical protein D6C95_05117 [Aureobasidium pullulans]
MHRFTAINHRVTIWREKQSTFLVASKYHNKSGKTVRPFLYNFPLVNFHLVLKSLQRFDSRLLLRLSISNKSLLSMSLAPRFPRMYVVCFESFVVGDGCHRFLVLFVCLRPSVDCCEVRSSQLDFGTVDITFTHKDHSCMIQQYEGSRYLVIGKSAVAIWLDSSLRNH